MKKLLTALLALALLCIAPAALALDVPASESEVPALPAAYTETAEKYEVPFADLFKSLEPGKGTEYRLVLAQKPELPADAEIEVLLQALVHYENCLPASDSVTGNGWELVYQPSGAYAPDELGVLIRYTFLSMNVDGKAMDVTDQYVYDQAGALRGHDVFLDGSGSFMNYFYGADNRLTAYETGNRMSGYKAYYTDGALQRTNGSFSMGSSSLLMSFDSENLPLDKEAAWRKVEPVTDEAGNEIGKLLVYFTKARQHHMAYFVRNDEPDVVYEYQEQNNWTKYDLANGVLAENVSPAGAPADPMSVEAPLVMGSLPVDAAGVALPADVQDVIDRYGFSDGLVKGVEELPDHRYRIHFSRSLSRYFFDDTIRADFALVLYVDEYISWEEYKIHFVEEEGGCYFDADPWEEFIDHVNGIPPEERVYTIELNVYYNPSYYNNSAYIILYNMFTADGKLIWRSVDEYMDLSHESRHDVEYEYEYGVGEQENGQLTLMSYNNGNLEGRYNSETGKLEEIFLQAYFPDAEEKESVGRLYLSLSADDFSCTYTDYLSESFLDWDPEQKIWTKDDEPYTGDLPDGVPANPEEIDLGVTL